MYIDYRIVDGCRGGLTFDFVPCMYALESVGDYDPHGPDVFNVREEAFLFIEGMVANAVPGWRDGYRHWGETSLPKATWLDILSQFSELRRDVKGNARLNDIVRKYVVMRGFVPPRLNFHRKALLRFLDQFEGRVRTTVEHYPYLIIVGV